MDRRLSIGIMAPLFIAAAGYLVNAETYRVVPGDSLFTIAQKYGTTVQSIVQQNGLRDSTIYPGQRLKVSSGRTSTSASGATHQVRSGESLYSIAQRYGTTVEALRAANGLSGSYIETGQRLIIPGGTGSTASGGTHTVAPGDTLFLLARRYGTTVDSLMRANNLTTAEIYPGQCLRLPAGSSSTARGNWAYTVRKGDTLYLLATRYGTTVQALRQLNGLNSNEIYPGQRLTIPGSGSSQPSSRNLSASDLDLLARLVSAEAAGEPYAGQVAVAATILNRLDDPRYPNTIPGVVYQYTDGAYQYSPVMDGRINQPATESAKAAVRDALNGWDPSYGATGFYNPAKTSNSWVRSHPVTTRIGDHVFFRY